MDCLILARVKLTDIVLKGEFLLHFKFLKFILQIFIIEFQKDMEAIIGNSLQDKDGKTALKPTSTYSPKFFGIYCGAHWAPPCRKFNEDLKKWYENVNVGTEANKKNVEIIFVSLDGNEAHFDRHFAMHPWLALPYEDEARVQTLKNKYDFKALPCLMITDPAGNPLKKIVDGKEENLDAR